MRFVAAILFALALPLAASAQTAVHPAKILADAEWRATYDEFQPVDGLILALGSGINEALEVDVYFAEWCDDSKTEVPRFIKIVERLSSPDLVVHYYGGIPHKAEGAKYFLADKKVAKVPTFIFSRNGREVGRIVEHPKDGLVEDFLEIVF